MATKRRSEKDDLGQDRHSPDQSVLDTILRAVFEQRIAPGTKLGEEALAGAFGVSRGRVRRVLVSLSHLGVVTLQPHRGAFVALPSEDDARDVFNARRVIEDLVIERVLERISSAGLKELRAHIRVESAARDAGQRREAIRLSGEFHLLLARLSGSRVLQGMMENLISRSSLIVGLFGAGLMSSCSVEHHIAIVEAIRAGEVDVARRGMVDHLQELQAALRLDIRDKDDVDLVAIFGGAAR